MVRSSLAVALLATGYFFAPASAKAQSSAAVVAQALFDQGKKLASEQRFAEACPKFAESQRLEAGVGTLLNLATCYAAQGRTASAWARFLEAAGMARKNGQSEQEQYALEHAAALAPQLSQVIIDATAAANTPGLEIRRDGILVGDAQWGMPIPVDPGPLSVNATAPGRLAWRTQISVVQPGGVSRVVVPSLSLRPIALPKATPVSRPDVAFSQVAPAELVLGPRRVAALAVGGFGLAGVVLGSAFGLSSKSLHDRAQSGCDGSACDEAGAVLMNDARSNGNVSTAAFVVGAVGLACGTWLWLSVKSPSVTPTRVGLTTSEMRVRVDW